MERSTADVCAAEHERWLGLSCFRRNTPGHGGPTFPSATGPVEPVEPLGREGALLVFSARLYDLLANPTAYAQADGGFGASIDRSACRLQVIGSGGAVQGGSAVVSTLFVCIRRRACKFVGNVDLQPLCKGAVPTRWCDGKRQGKNSNRYAVLHSPTSPAHGAKYATQTNEPGLRRNHKQITNPWRAGCG